MITLLDLKQKIQEANEEIIANTKEIAQLVGSKTKDANDYASSRINKRSTIDESRS